jgi:hypothetical protein
VKFFPVFLIKHCPVKAYGEMEIELHAFLSSVPYKGEWSSSFSSGCFPGERDRGIP